MLSKGPPTASVMYKYLAFKGTTNSNCIMQVLFSERGPNSNFIVSTIPSKGSHYHLQCANKEKLQTNFST